LRFKPFKKGKIQGAVVSPNVIDGDTEVRGYDCPLNKYNERI
jgi:hypothetical protein